MAKQGWATGMVAGNVYLSSNFDMADGWGLHRCVNWPQGSTQIRRGEAFLNDHADQPSFLLLHLMDMHLPYTEPLGYRSLFVDDVPEGKVGRARGELRREKSLIILSKKFVRLFLRAEPFGFLTEEVSLEVPLRSALVGCVWSHV